jgi:hypothetical protein
MFIYENILKHNILTYRFMFFDKNIKKHKTIGHRHRGTDGFEETNKRTV